MEYLSQREAWNISGDPCSGAAIDDAVTTSNEAYNPLIKCVCSNSTCHITDLIVKALDVVGEIPEELWSLTFLTNIDLRQNYLTGPLSQSIGNLTRMQYLSFTMNALSSEMPKELGKLTDLVSLAFSTNNFSGFLPSELGNLTNLEQIYIDSSGVSGAIPSTFAHLQNLVTVWASDNELTGRIPDFIGNWSKLTTLLLVLSLYLAASFVLYWSCVPRFLKLMMKLSSQTNELYQLAVVVFCLGWSCSTWRICLFLSWLVIVMQGEPERCTCFLPEQQSLIISLSLPLLCLYVFLSLYFYFFFYLFFS